MSEKVSSSSSVPSADHLNTLQKVKSTLEVETIRKVKILKEKYNNLQTVTPEIYSYSGLQEIKCALPVYLLAKAEEITNEVMNGDHKYLQLFNALKEMNEQQNEAVQYLVKAVAMQRTEFRRLQQRSQYLKNEKLMQHNSDDEQTEYDVNEINKKSTLLFASVKRDLQFVIRSFFNEDMENLLMDLTNSYFKGGDEQYVVFKDYNLNNVLILFDANLIVPHPTDNNQIKFDKFT